MAISTNGTIITRLAGALYGEYLSNASYTDLATTAPATVAANFLTNDFASKTDSQLATTILTNLGLTSITGLDNWLAAQLTAAGSTAAAKGAALVSILNGYAGMTADATYGTYAVGFNTKVAASLALSQTAGSAGGAFATADTVVVSNQTFTLTSGTNAFTGSTGDDTFDAGLSISSLQTLNSGDRLDGGAGTDELFAVVNSSVTPASVANIENVTLTNITTAATVDLTNATGLVNVTNQAATVALTIAGVSKSANVVVRDTAIAGQVVSYSDVTGTSDSATVVLQNLSGAATVTVAGVETLTLNSSGGATNVAGLTSANTTTLNVTGTQGLTLGTLGTSVTKVDASTNTGATAGVSATMANTGSAHTVIGGSGHDSFTLGSGAGADNVAGGAGNDTIIYTANFTTADTINGGDGTDSLRAIAADLVTASASTPTTYTVTNVETIQATTQLANSSSINVPNISSTATRLNLALTGAVIAGTADTIVGGSGSFTLGLGGSAAGNTAGLLTNASTLTVNDTGAAITDSLTITNSAANSTTGLNVNVYDSSNLAINGYETVTINSGSIAGGATSALGTVTVTGDVGGTSAETVNFTGANNVSVGVITADIINASALTASSGTVFDMVTNSTATTITGSAGIDDLHGNTALASSIDGGAGNDSITGGTGNDTLKGGDGSDTITNGGGAGDSVDGGAGNDVVVATLTAGNTIVGGEGTDVLSLAAAATASTATGVSGFETFRLTANTTQDMIQFIENSTFTTIQGALAGATTAFTNVAPGVTTFATTAATNTSTFARLIDTSSNSLNVVLLGNASTTALTANDEETINLSTSSAVGATTLATLTATDLHTLNITGTNAITITNAIAANTTTAGTTLTINASANTGGVSLSAASSTIVANITGSSTAANTLVGTGGSDTITGGGLADNITAGVGYDTITGGAGADTFVFANTATGTPSATGNAFDVITDYVSGSDVIDFGAITILQNPDAGAAAAGHAGVTGGVVTFHISDNTLALRIAAVQDAINDNDNAADSNDAAAGDALIFAFGGDSYIFVSDATAGVGATDVLIKLTGIAGSTTTDSLTIVGGDITALA